MTPFALCQTLCSMQVSAQLLHSDLFGACSLCNVLTSSTSPQVLCIARALKCDRAHAPQVYSEAAAGAASAGAGNMWCAFSHAGSERTTALRDREDPAGLGGLARFSDSLWRSSKLVCRQGTAGRRRRGGGGRKRGAAHRRV